jgi:hypothetical protein
MRGVLHLRLPVVIAMLVSALVYAPGAQAASLSVRGTDPVVADVNDTNVVMSGWASPGATVDVTVTDGTTTVPGSTTAGADGSWMVNNLDASSLNEGTITYSATSNSVTVDRTANKNRNALVYINYDATNPVTSTSKNSISLKGCAEPSQEVDLVISDGTHANTGMTTSGADGSCPFGSGAGGYWSFSGRSAVGLTDGPITYTVTSNGHAAVAPALLDTSTTVTITTWPHPYITSGNENPATISGTAEMADSISLLVSDGVSGHNVSGTTTADSGGNWSFTGLNLSGLNDGGVTITVTATDRVNNTANDVKSVTKDTTAPGAPVISTWTHPINASNVSSASISGTAEANASISLTVSDGTHNVTGSTTADGSGNWSFTGLVLTSLNDGAANVSYSVTATDAAGNTSPAGQKTGVMKDVLVPSAPAISTWTHPYINAGNVANVGISGTSEANATINLTISDGSANVTGSTTADGSGNWSFTKNVSTLADGTNNISYTVTATDAAGNTSPAASKTGVTKDTTAPGAPVISTWTHPINASNYTSASISGTSEANASISLTVSDGTHNVTGSTTADGSGNWSFTGLVLTSLNDGAANVSYSVTATDAAGNTSSVASKTGVTKDTGVPSAPVISTWTHPINAGNVSSASTSGTSEANATINLTVSDGTHNVTSSTSADGSGNWSISGLVLTSLNDGTANVSYSVTATDAVGNTSTAAQKTGVTKDTGVPSAPVISTWTHPINASNFTNASITGTSEANATISLDVSDGTHHVTASTTANSGGNWWFTTGLDLTSLNDGTANVSYGVTATDAVGNTSTAAQKTGVSKDVVVPSAPVISTWTHPINAGNVSSASITGTSEANATISLTVSDGTHQVTPSTSADGSGNWSFTSLVLTSLNDGTANISYSVTATDAVGNTSPATSKTGVTKDTGVPSAPVISTWTHPINASNVTAATISGTAEANSTIGLTITDGSASVTGSMSADGSGNWSFTKNVSTLADGTAISYSVTATDAVGNTSPAAAKTGVTKDTGIPGAPSIDTWSHPINAGNVGSATISGTAEVGATINLTITDGSTSVTGSTTVNGSGNWSITKNVSTLADGTANISYSVTATDAVGNTSPAATKTGVSKDTIVPAAPVISTWTHPYINVANVGSAFITGTAEASATVSLDVSDGVHHVPAMTTADGGGNWSFSGLNLGSLSDGVSNVAFSVTATDAVGNTSPSAVKSGITKDTGVPSPPLITGRTEVITGLNLGNVSINGMTEALAQITLDLTDGSHHVPGSTTADSGGNWSITGLVAGSLDDGTNNITFSVTATDLAGNTGSAATAISSKDTVGVTVPAAPTIGTATAAKGSAVVTWTAPSYDGNSPILNYTATAVEDGTKSCQAVGAAATSCKVSELLSTQSYTFTVTATNGRGTSAPSAASNAVTPLAPTRPDPPTTVVGKGLDQAIQLNWTAPAENGGRMVTLYTVTTYTKDAGGNTVVVPGATCTSTGSPAAATCTVEGLSNGTKYTFTVTATNAVGTSDPSAPSKEITARVGNTYVPLIPTRILDTAVPIGNTEGTPIAKAQIPAQVPLTFDVANQYPGDSTRNVPTNATAVTGVLSVVGGPVNGYLGLTPEPMTIPNISNLNFPPHDRRSTGVTITLGHDATLSVSYAGTTKGAVDIAFDVTGYFVEGTSGATYNAVTPTRILDSRHGFGQAGGKPAKFASGVHQCFPVAGLAGVPTAAVAVTGNLTVTHQSSAGLATVGPEPDDAPTTATVYAPRWTSKVQDNRATGVTIKLDSGGSLCAVWVGAAGSTADVIFDVNGYFVPGGGGAMYVPITPNRIYDTRRPFPSSARILVGRYGQMFTVVNQKPTDPTQNVPSDAVAVTGTLTVTRQKKLGYLSLTTTQYKYPSVPSTSTLNFLLDNRATGVTVPLGSGGRLGIFYGPYKGVTCHAIFDVGGYFVQ